MKAGEAYQRAIQDDPEAQTALQRTRERLQAFAQSMQQLNELPEYRAAKAEEREHWDRFAVAIKEVLQTTGDDLATKHFPRPENIDDWEHLAHIVEIPLETIKSGKLTARDIFACALGWADQQQIKAKLTADNQDAVNEEPSPDRTIPDTAHSTDFRSVQVLWRNWAQGTPVVSEVTILDDAGSAGDRLRDVFEKGKHPAWGQ